MITTTITTTDYLPGEALTGRMTAREWLERFAPTTLEVMHVMAADDPNDPALAVDLSLAEITEVGHTEARRLGLPASSTGHYPGVVWELGAAKHWA
ncbi:hypothetical protein [Hyphomicrobium sp.]|uniref:hypothetical protein n=1 Tax=Hyphomicrobium sp. TaxID=82 RepID=UPI002FDEA94D